MMTTRDEILAKARQFGWTVSEVHRTRSNGELTVKSATLVRQGSPSLSLTFNHQGTIRTAEFIELDWLGQAKKPAAILTDKKTKVLARLPHPWTRFMDMHSGGRTKEGSYQYIYIQAAEDQAKVIFYNRFGHNPERITCTCCGEDYSISQSESLEQATGYERGCKSTEEGYVEVQDDGGFSYQKYTDLTTYMTEHQGVDTLFIADDEISDHQRVGSVPTEGWVWS